MTRYAAYWLWALESQLPSKQKMHAASGRVIEEKKFPSFTRIQCWGLPTHLTGALHAAAQISGRINTQNHCWVTIKLWFRKTKVRHFL